jgi:hypothetical protein
MNKMIASRESLEWIVDALIKGNKVPNKQGINLDSSNVDQSMRKTRKSQSKSSTLGGRIAIEKRPSQRVNKAGIMLTHYNPSMFMSPGGGMSPSSRSRGNLSPMRSPTPKGRIGSGTASPLRSTSKGFGSPLNF